MRWWFPVFRLPRWRNGGAIAAVDGVAAAVSMCYSDDCDVYLRQKCGAETAKLWCIYGVYMIDFLHFGCQGGEMVVRRWWLGFAISAEIHCVAAVAWCVSGVSNPDFTNFTKHSTVLTSISRQISILYQHFPSAETAIPELEQAKTMLKIALSHVQKR